MAESLDRLVSALPRRSTGGAIMEDDDIEDELEFDHYKQFTAMQDAEDYTLKQFQQDFKEAELMQENKKRQDKPDFIKLCQQYVRRREHRWGDKTSAKAGSRNFLHHLAYESCKNPRYPQWLVKMAINSQPHLMGVVDEKGRTPLTAAICDKNLYFCHYAVLSQNTRTGVWAKHLLEECKEGREVDHDRETTCLHAAISASFYGEVNLNREAFIESLIRLVPIQLFMVKDMKGRTPLHLAVQYRNCSPLLQSIVLSLLEKAPKAVEVESQELGRNLSIFQFHELSKREDLEKYEKNRRALEKDLEKKEQDLEKKEQSQRKTIDQPAGELLYGSKMPGGTDNAIRDKEKGDTKRGTDRSESVRKSDQKKAESKPKRGLMEPPPLPKDKMSSPVANAAARRSSITGGATQSRNASPKPAYQERVAATLQTEASPAVGSQNSIKSRLTEMEEEELDRRQAAGAIIEHLKLHCLRNCEPDTASRLLRSLDGKEEKALWFDFGPPRKISMKDFKRSFEHFRFESILQYVAFPHIDLVMKEGISENKGAIKSADVSPMVVLFDWLRQKERGVTRILRVIVDDLQAPSHTDEAIEKALKDFKVEILDWRRADLCPVSLVKIGSHLKEVTLYWSGNNAVLRGWSEREGLSKLPNLKIVNIVELNKIESDDRVNGNLDAFRDRLQKNCWENFCEDDPRPRPPGKPIPKVNTKSGRRLLVLSQHDDNQHAMQGFDKGLDRRIDPHRWLECMKEFSKEFLQVVNGPVQRDTNSALGPVVIALIDDGANTEHPDLSLQKNPKGKSFYKYREESGVRVDPWWHSESGHGTLMARLIAAICPSAIIHTIKLQTHYAHGSKKLQIDPNSAREAIEYATELGAHIICTSWTIKPPEGKARAEIQKAIDSVMVNSDGEARGIHMFCAASDQGNYVERTLPYTANSNIFRIGGAAATGKIMDVVGDQDHLSFLLPGHEVVIDDWYDDSRGERNLNRFEPHSGSSVATALAAGLAALIMECVRLGMVHTNASPPAQQQDSTIAIKIADLQRIREHEAMHEALSSMCTDSNNKKYLKVWDLFEKNSEKLKKARLNALPEEQMEIISGLARHFLRKAVY